MCVCVVYMILYVRVIYAARKPTTAYYAGLYNNNEQMPPTRL